VANLTTQKRVYRVQTNPMTEAGIDPGFTRDLYVSLGEELPGGGWSVRIYYKPYIRWIWLGAILMALGGLLAAADRRYRIKARRVPQATVAPGMASAKTP
jgi:cytochrome c-type biogenesis protein CcmF